jgi:hypothetical protein
MADLIELELDKDLGTWKCSSIFNHTTVEVYEKDAEFYIKIVNHLDNDSEKIIGPIKLQQLLVVDHVLQDLFFIKKARL